MKEAIHRKLQDASFRVSVKDVTQQVLFNQETPLLISEELFTVHPLEISDLERKKLQCVEWQPSERTGVLAKHKRALRNVLNEKRDWLEHPFALYDFVGLDADTSQAASRLLDSLDVFDEGAVMSFGSTFTRYHVEDYAMANLQTLQRRQGNSFKAWFIVVDPVRGQQLRRAQDHVVSERLVESADYIIIQREGETIYVPPLAYHAVLTAYHRDIPVKDRYTVLSGTLFADTRSGSLWRKRLVVWAQNHQTGHRHSGGQNRDAVYRGYAKYLDVPTTKRRPSKQQRKKDKAAKASNSRWSKGSK